VPAAPGDPVITKPASGLRFAVLLLIGPVLLLTAVDRAIVLWRAHWAWVAREVPPQLLDPYRIEGILRTTPPGPRTVFLLGDSTMEEDTDRAALDRAFARQGLRFRTLSIGATPALAFGFLARPIAALRPSAVVLLVSAYGVRSRNFLDSTYTYDALVAPDLFTARELLSDPFFHLEGLAEQSNILFRHRRAMQQALAIRWGKESWRHLQREQLREGIRQSMRRSPLLAWVSERAPDAYPNPNTRAIEVLARRLRAVGCRFIVIESPGHPLTGLLVRPARARAFHEMMRAMATRDGFTFVSAEQLPQFVVEDFRDQTHLNEQGQRTFTDALEKILRSRPGAG
jgi:hypothetical protein